MNSRKNNIPVRKGGLTIVINGKKLEYHAGDSSAKRRKTLRSIVEKGKNQRAKGLSVMRALQARLNLGKRRMDPEKASAFEADIGYIRKKYFKKVKNPKTSRMVYAYGRVGLSL